MQQRATCLRLARTSLREPNCDPPLETHGLMTAEAGRGGGGLRRGAAENVAGTSQARPRPRPRPRSGSRREVGDRPQMAPCMEKIPRETRDRRSIGAAAREIPDGRQSSQFRWTVPRHSATFPCPSGGIFVDDDDDGGGGGYVRRRARARVRARGGGKERRRERTSEEEGQRRDI